MASNRLEGWTGESSRVVISLRLAANGTPTPVFVLRGPRSGDSAAVVCYPVSGPIEASVCRDDTRVRHADASRGRGLRNASRGFPPVGEVALDVVERINGRSWCLPQAR